MSRVPEIARRLAGRKLASAESCTGGLLAQAFARAEGSAEWFPGGIVAYQPSVKYELLGVTRGPVVSHGAAQEMARGAARLFAAEVAVSVTGAAGPAPHQGAPPGTVYIATYVEGACASTQLLIPGDPEMVCRTARDRALDALFAALAPAPVHDGERV